MRETAKLNALEKRATLAKLRSELRTVGSSVKPATISPLVAAIFAGTAGILGNTWVAYLSGRNALELEQVRSEREFQLEKSKNESALIIEAIKTGDVEKAKNNLRFFIEAGLIDNADQIITRALAASPVVLPSQESPSPSYQPCPFISQEFVTEGADYISIHYGTNKVDSSKYEGWDGALTASEFDAIDMAALASNIGYISNLRVKSLVRRECFEKDLTELAGKLAQGDVLLVTFSGHANSVPDFDNDEPAEDMHDETLVLYDGQILDDEVETLIANFVDGTKLILVFDTMNITLEMPDGEVPADIIVINGASTGQAAADGTDNGLFTSAVLAKSSILHEKTYNEFVDLVRESMPTHQTPSITLVSGSPELLEGKALR